MTFHTKTKLDKYLTSKWTTSQRSVQGRTDQLLRTLSQHKHTLEGETLEAIVLVFREVSYQSQLVLCIILRVADKAQSYKEKNVGVFKVWIVHWKRVMRVNCLPEHLKVQKRKAGPASVTPLPRTTEWIWHLCHMVLLPGGPHWSPPHPLVTSISQYYCQRKLLEKQVTRVGQTSKESLWVTVYHHPDHCSVALAWEDPKCSSPHSLAVPTCELLEVVSWSKAAGALLRATPPLH